MQKTFLPKDKDLIRKWYLVDAQEKVLGRLASRIATILRGKNKPLFTPHMDVGDGVVVVNASKVSVTGRKMKGKLYTRYSGYPGGLKVKNLEEMLRRNPAEVLTHAVKGMLPKGPLGRRMIKKLKVYSGSEHPHKAQKLEPLKN